MSSNFNTNRRTQEYNFKSKVFDDYPTSNLNSMNYDADNGWQDTSPVTPRISTTRRIDTQSMRSSNINDSATKSKDEFTIFGSFVRQKSERRGDISLSERTRTVPRQASTFKNLPVKSQPSEDFSSEYSSTIKRETINVQQSQPQYTPQSTFSPDSLFELIRTQDETDAKLFDSNPKFKAEYNNRIPVEQETIMPQRNIKIESAFPAREYNNRVPVEQESIMPQRNIKIESSLPTQSSIPERSQDQSLQGKEGEIARLQKSIESKNKKFENLRKLYEKLQVDLKNLLNERKQLLHQIENTEFEEIIEEEEVQEPKTNYVVREVQKPMEVSHANCLQRGKATIDDVQERLLDSYRNEIIHQVREQQESEHRTIMESLRNQQQKKLSDLQAEYETLKKSSIQRERISLEDVPRRMLESYREQITSQIREQTDNEKRTLLETLKIQQQKQVADLQAEFETVQKKVLVTKKTRYNQIVTDTNIQRAPSPKPLSASVGVNVIPVVMNRQCQCECNGSRSSLNQYAARTEMSSWQKSIIEKVLSSAESNNYEELLATLREAFCKPTNSIGINCTAVSATKTTNTVRINSSDVSSEFNIPIEVVTKPVVAQESRAIMVKPVLLQRGCQPEDTFKFETGTMTDQIFCRSQGMMTVSDYPEHRSPLNVEQESVTNRSTSRSESRKQTISQTTFVTSPTKDFERALSPRFVKQVNKIPETVVEDIIEIKNYKVENTPIPVSVTEEVRHIVEEKTQHVTSVLDQNKVPKKEIPTKIECWETVSHLKDGEVIKKTETYHDQLVSTDPDKIKEHLERYNKGHSTEVSPTITFNKETVMNFDENAIMSPKTPNKSIPLQPSSTIIESTSSSKTNETSRKASTSSENSSSSPDITAKGIKPNFRKPSQKGSTYSESEYTIVTSGLKKPLNIKEVNVVQKSSVPDLKKTIHQESQKTFTSSNIQKPSEIIEVKVGQKMSEPEVKRTIHHDSERTFTSSNVKKPSEIIEVKVGQKMSEPNVKSTIYHESEKSFPSSNIKKPFETKEIKIEKNVSGPSEKSSIYHEFENTFTSKTINKPSEKKEIRVEQKNSVPNDEKTIFQQNEERFMTNTVNKPVEIRQKNVEHTFSVPSVEKTIFKESEQVFLSSGITVPEVKEIKVQQMLSSPTLERTTYQELHSSNTKKPIDVKEIKIQNNFPSESMASPYPQSDYTMVSGGLTESNDSKEINILSTIDNKPLSSMETTYYKTEQILSSGGLNKPITIKGSPAELNFSSPTVKETTYEETAQTVTYTTTTSKIPMTYEGAKNLVQSRTSNSIGLLSSPKAFHSYSSTQARSNFSSSKTENLSFESDVRSKSIPIKIQSFESTKDTSTRIPINIAGSSSIASSNSAFKSISSNVEKNKLSYEGTRTDVSEIFLSENIFKCCSELLIWLKTINIITTSTVEFLPSNLVDVSSTLVDWWADVTTNMDASRLLATAQYLISTFNKILLKYLIINLDQQGNTCLHYIIGHQLWDTFGVLESTKLVDPDIYNSQGYTVLMVACTSIVTSDIARDNLRRLALGANVNLTSKVQGQTAIFIAAFHNNSYMIQMLLSLGADINIRDKDDNTPLIIACSKNHIDSVATILSGTGVLVDLKNKEGKTAFDIANESGFTDLLEIFSQRKSTRASEISSYSGIIQKSYSNRSFSSKKY